MKIMVLYYWCQIGYVSVSSTFLVTVLQSILSLLEEMKAALHLCKGTLYDMFVMCLLFVLTMLQGAVVFFIGAWNIMTAIGV